MANGQQAAVREGNRWLHAKPTSEDFAAWFTEAVPIDDSLESGKYIGGITLISATEKAKITLQKGDGTPYLREVEQVVYIPYPKVETRVQYFWDLMHAKQDELFGVIEPDPSIDRIGAEEQQLRYFNRNLPPGFFLHPVTWFNNSNERLSIYLGCAMRVMVYRQGDREKVEKGERAIPVIQGYGAKTVPVQKNYPDDFALMKAQTGALGRALGMAGIMVVPGAGIATAEDVQEALAAETGPTTPGGDPAAAQTTAQTPATFQAEAEQGQQAQTPAGTPPPGAERELTDDEMREQVAALTAQLEAEHPDVLERFRAWYKNQQEQRGIGTLDTLQGPTLKGILRRLQRAIAQAREEDERETQEREQAESVAKPKPPEGESEQRLDQ